MHRSLRYVVTYLALCAFPLMATHARAAKPSKDTSHGKVETKRQVARKKGSTNQGVARAAQSVVRIYRQGRPVGLGMTLRGDGRILTALSTLSRGVDHLRIRFANGLLTNATVDYTDATVGLALLAPEHKAPTQGLAAARRDASTKNLRVFVPKGPRAVARPVKLPDVVQGTALGRLQPIPDAPHSSLGSPVVTSSGRALGLVVRACRMQRAKPVCEGPTLMASVRAIRQMMTKATSMRSWTLPTFGLEVQASSAPIPRGVRVVKVMPGSLAARLGLVGGTADRPGDVILAVDGVPVTSERQLAERLRQMADRKGKLIVWRRGRFIVKTFKNSRH